MMLSRHSYSGWNRILLANICMPRSAKMNMNMITRMKNAPTSMNVSYMRTSRFCISVHFLASLKMRSRRSMRKIERELPFGPKNSKIDVRTMKPSNLLKLSAQYVFIPSAPILRSISIKKQSARMLPTISSSSSIFSGMPWWSSESTSVFTRMSTITMLLSSPFSSVIQSVYGCTTFFFFSSPGRTPAAAVPSGSGSSSGSLSGKAPSMTAIKRFIDQKAPTHVSATKYIMAPTESVASMVMYMTSDQPSIVTDWNMVSHAAARLSNVVKPQLKSPVHRSGSEIDAIPSANRELPKASKFDPHHVRLIAIQASSSSRLATARPESQPCLPRRSPPRALPKR
mmetsp:Transcript_73765/g.210347  ORF Transcript_73765/g.210347 Transcript_73765/m.210347 type:complete len:341 (+) Transcript_73765:1308-2330(+)